MHRLDFLRTLAASALARLAPSAASPAAPVAQGPASDASRQAGAADELPTRPLGGTGARVTILGLGGYHVGLAGSAREAHAIVDAALAEGVRFFDTAESYQDGTSERWLGAALRDVLRGGREQVFLMSKTFDFPGRTARGARRHLEGTLRRLGTDRLDLWQLHGVRSVADVDRAFAPGGAVEAILAAKREGTVRFVGVTGHADPEANLRALHHWDRGLRFDAMQLPLNPVDWHRLSFQRRVLPELARRGIGVIAMKCCASGGIPREGVYTAAECLRYVWSLPAVSVAVVGMERPGYVRENARLARTFSAMSPAERDALLARSGPRASSALEWYKG